MDLSWEWFLGALILLVLGSFVKKIMSNEPIQRDEFNGAMGGMRKDHQELRELIFKEYVHKDDLKELETRIMHRFDDLSTEIKDLRQ